MTIRSLYGSVDMLGSSGFYAFRSTRSPSVMTSTALQALLVKRGLSSERGDQLEPSCLVRPYRKCLVILEAVNAGGKDGVIEEIFSVLGEGNLRVERFRRPPNQPDRDLLDLALRVSPAAGELVFFNRSYYEAPVSAARKNQPDVSDLCDRIVRFEETLVRNGTLILKLFLHIDKSEQFRRLENRRSSPALLHLHNSRDYEDQDHWEGLMRVYDVVLSATHTTASPWLLIPSNERQLRNSAVKEVLAETLRPGFRS